ncbi:MAG TPA: HAD-IA family hydrolase [Ktedonobacteraceae bacterium]|nr:HAD-IA family hydrolase [Ktedonobacteraceae bacterium]
MLLEQPQSIRTIFFDAGFTLLHPNPSTAEICQRICRQLDLHIHLEKLQERITDAENFFFSQTRLRRYMWDSEQTINAFWIEYYMNFLRPFVEEQDETRLYELARLITHEFDQHTSWQTYPDVVPTLDALKEKNYTLGVISDWGIALGHILHELRLNKYFDSLVVSALARHAKPSPSLYDLALQRANSIADYTLHIGDSYILDVLGARAAGITPILLDRDRKLQASKIDCIVIHSLSDIPKLLEVE